MSVPMLLARLATAQDGTWTDYAEQDRYSQAVGHAR